MIATLSERTRCDFVIKDYVFDKEMNVEGPFGTDQNEPKERIGSIVMDEEGERVFVVNGDGTLLKTYSIFDIRVN